MDHKIRSMSVRWQDNSYDHKRVCDECGKPNCSYPVYNDFYREVVTKKSYWNWAEKNNENTNSNPDFLGDDE